MWEHRSGRSDPSVVCSLAVKLFLVMSVRCRGELIVILNESDLNFDLFWFCVLKFSEIAR